MKIAKWFLVLFMSLGFFAVPTAPVQAEGVSLNLGGFPSYFRQRVRLISGATYVSALGESGAMALGYESDDDQIFFADTTFRLTPQLVLSDAVTIRTQVDVFSNNLWGGLSSDLLGAGGAAGSTRVNSALSTQDRVRGALLTGDSATDDNGFLEIRMLHIDMVLPDNLGFVRIGRQPFDWGLGLLANGGWDPHSDLGFLVDRFLWLKTFPNIAGDASLTAVVVSDIITGGNTLVSGTGNAYDIAALALLYNKPDVSGINLTVGAYVFPYIHQDNFSFGTDAYTTLGCDGVAPITEANEDAITADSTAAIAGVYDPDNPGATCTSTGVADTSRASLHNPTGDLKRFTLYSGLVDLKTDMWRVIGEIQGGWGTLENFVGASETDIEHQMIWAIRGEWYPSMPVSVVGAEFGWADGDKATTGATDKIEGNIIVFSPAYNLDNLLFKHMIPNIYQTANAFSGGAVARNESSVQNAYYARVYSTVKLNDAITFTPQALIAWNNETDSVLATEANGGGDVDSFLGTEIEGTLSWSIYPGVAFDLIGSVIFAGDGLTDLLEDQASIRCGATADCGAGEATDMPYAVQGRLLVSIDQFFK